MYSVPNPSPVASAESVQGSLDFLQLMGVSTHYFIWINSILKLSAQQN